MRKSDGFTLVELMVGILCAAIVTGAAMTLMLMGTRTNRALLDANSEQNTARIITTMVESLASEGDISKIYVGYEEYKSTDGEGGYSEQDWAIFGSNVYSPILSYSFDEQTIFTAENNALMTGVTSSTLTLSRDVLSGCLLGFMIQTEEGRYESVSYCRTADIETEGLVLDKNSVSAEDSDRKEEVPAIVPNIDSSNPDAGAAGRYALLQVLCSQYGSTGKFTGSTGAADFNNTFSGWYLKTKYPGQSSYLPGWNTDTPWCACFVSWGIAQIKDTYLESAPPPFAHVEAGKDSLGTSYYRSSVINPTTDISPGDLIFFDFFDWEDDPAIYEGEIPHTSDHIGVVFYVDSEYIYTIEGNTSIENNIGRVDLKRYKLGSAEIDGYGILNWK